jgi:mannose-6-phosphate isomerase-like protein (cupin superfamily)
VKILGLGLLAAALAMAAGSDIDLYSPQDLQKLVQTLSSKKAPFASESLKKYGSDHTMIAYREETGSSEVHQKEADFFFVVDGSAAILTGGKLVNPHTEAAGELRGTSVAGGERHELAKGAVIHIPAGTPHQVLIKKGTPFTYFVVKVIEK